APDRNVLFTLSEDNSNNDFPRGWGQVGATQNTYTLTVEDDDSAPVAKGTIGFASPAMVKLTEDGAAGNATLQLLKSDGSAFTASTPTIPLAVSFGGDVNNSNFADEFTVNFANSAHGSFNSSSRSLSIASGQSHSNGEITLSIAPQGDDIPESPEEYTVTIAEGATGFPGDSWSVKDDAKELTIRIAANDNFIGFAKDPVPPITSQEGATLTLPVLLSAYGPQDLTLAAKFEGRDYSGNRLNPADAPDISFDSGIVFTSTGQDDADAGAPGHQYTRNLDITIEQNDGPENAEEFAFTLEFPDGVTPDGFEFNDKHTFTIPAHGNTVTFAAGNPASFDEGAAGQTVNLLLTNAMPEAFAVTIATSGGDAGDITITSDNYSGSVLTIPQHATEASFTVTADDDSDSANENITLTLTGPGAPDEVAGWEVPANTTYSFNLIDDDISTIGFANDEISVLETPVPLKPDPDNPDKTASTRSSENTLKLAVAILDQNGDPVPTEDIPSNLPVTITSSDTNGDDITVTSPLNIKTLVSADGLAEIDVTIVDDKVTEDTEVFTLTMGPGTNFPSNYGIARGGETFEITILPSESTIGFAETSETIYEDVGAHEVKVVLSSPAPSGLQQDGILVSLKSNNANIIEPTYDPSYTPGSEASGEVYLIPSGVREYVLPVTVNSGAVSGSSDDVTLTLALAGENNPSDWSANPNEQTLTVRSAAGTIGFADLSVPLKEGELGALVISLSRPAPSGGLNVFLSDEGNQRDLIIGQGVGSGLFRPFTGPGDSPFNTCTEDALLEYPNSGCGVVHVPAGANEVVVSVRAFDDEEAEEEETHELTLSSVEDEVPGTGITPRLPAGWTIPISTIMVTVAASDNIIRLSDSTSSAESEGDTGSFIVSIPASSLANLPTGGLTIPVSVAPDATDVEITSGTSGNQISLVNSSTPPGEVEIGYRVIQDNIKEEAETVIVALGSPTISDGREAEGWSFAEQGTGEGRSFRANNPREPYNEYHIPIEADSTGTLGVVGFETDESTIVEGGSGTDIQVKIVSTVAAPAGGFSLDIAHDVDGTSNPGTDGAITISDVGGTANAAVFAAGATEATINISAAADSVLDVTDVTLTITSDLTTIPAISTWALGRDTHLVHIQDALDKNLINVVTRARTASEGDRFELVLDIPEEPLLSNASHNFAVSIGIESGHEGDVSCIDEDDDSDDRECFIEQTDLRSPADRETRKRTNIDAVFVITVTDDSVDEGVEEVDLTFNLTRTNGQPNPIMPTGWTAGEVVTTLRIDGSDQTVGFAARTAELDLSDSTALMLPVALSRNAPSTHNLDPDGTPDSGDELVVGGLRLLITANHPKIVFDNSSLPAYQRGSLSPQQTIVTVPGGVTRTNISVPFDADDFDDGDAQIVRFSMAPVGERLYSPSQDGVPTGEPWEPRLAGLPGEPYPGWEIGNDVSDVTILPPRTIGFSTYYSRVDEGGTSEVEVVLSRPAPSGGLTATIVSNDTKVLKFGTTADAATDTFDAVFNEGSKGPVMVNVFALDDPMNRMSDEKQLELEDVKIPVNAGNSVDLTVVQLPSGWSQAKPQPYGIASIYALHSVFIDDNDIKTAGWELTESEVTESSGGNNNADGSVDLTVELSQAAPAGIVFSANVRSRKQGIDTQFDGNGEDYDVTPSTGSTSATVSVPITNDTVVQGTRYLEVTLSVKTDSSNEWSINPLRETLLLKVLDDDGHTVSIDTARSTSTSFEGDPDAKLVLSLSGPAPAGNRGAGVVPGSFCVKTGNGPCVYPTYTGGLGVTIHTSDIADAHTNPLTVIIPEGRTTHEVPLSVLRDAVVEPNGSTVEFRLGLNIGHTRTSDGGTPNDPTDDTWTPDVSGWRIGSPSTHTLTISPDDTKVVYFADRSSAWRERDGTGDVRLRFTEVPDRDIVLALTSADPDNVTVASSVTISPSDVDSTNRVATVPFFQIVNDNVYEDNESVAVNFTVYSPSDWNAGRSTHYVRIHPSDNRPENNYAGFLDPANRSIAEGTGHGHLAINYGVITDDPKLKFPVASGAGLLIEYLHADGTDASDEIERSNGSPVLAKADIPEILAEYAIRAKADADDEGDETIRIRLKEDPAKPLPETWKLRNHEIFVRILEPREMRFVFSPALAADTTDPSRPRWEIDENAGTASFELTLNRPAPQDVALTFTEHDPIIGFEVQGTDAPQVSTTAKTVVFPRGAIRLEVVADITDIPSSGEGVLRLEGVTEFGIIDILTGSAAVPNQQDILVAVTDNDAVSGTTGTIGFATTTAIELTEDGGAENATLQLRMSDALAFTGNTPEIPLAVSFGGDFDANNPDFTIDFATRAHGTFTSSSGLLSVASGQSHSSGDITLNVAPQGDSIAELREEYTVTISRGAGFPTGWTVDDSANKLTVRIAANDNTVTFGDPSSTSIVEETGSATIALTIAQPIPDGETATITIGQTNTNLVENTHYSLSVAGGTLSGSTWTLPTGAGSATLTVTASSDIANDETLAFTFAAGTLPGGWELAGNTSPSITITDEDAAVTRTVMFTDPSSTLPEARGTVDVGVTLSEAAPSGGVEVTATIDSGGQYIELASGSITVTSGTTGDFTVKIPSSVEVISSDAIATLVLAAPTGWGLGTQSTHTITITPATQRVVFASSATEYPVREGESVSVRFTASATHTAPFDIDATIPSADQSFVSVASLPVNTFAAGQTAGVITFNALDNSADDGDRTVVIPLSRNTNFPDGWRLVPDSVTLAIEEDDDDSTIGFASPTTIDLTEDGTAGSAALQLRMPDGTAFTGSTSAVPIALDFGGDENEGDFTIGFANAAHGSFDASSGLLSVAAGQTHSGGLIPLEIVPLADSTPEAPEEYTVTLSRTENFPDDWDVDSGANRLTIRIPANENSFTFSELTNDKVSEGSTRNLVINFDNTLTGDATLRIDVTGSGIDGDDFSISGTGGTSFSADNTGGTDGGILTIPSGTALPVSLSIATRVDGAPEADEVATFTLNGTHAATRLPSGWEIGSAGDASEAITILANENTVDFKNPDPDVIVGTGTAEITLEIEQPIPAGETATIPVESTNANLTRGTHYSLSVSGGSLGGTTWTLP
ncbi:MAG: hypothetical protein OXF05_09525, partial [Hyphomicrobiales bacterium]|nr:hypothetical protein [Hyphomicrobiales bacterium]